MRMYSNGSPSAPFFRTKEASGSRAEAPSANALVRWPLGERLAEAETVGRHVELVADDHPVS